jgi:hypothetical protein
MSSFYVRMGNLHALVVPQPGRSQRGGLKPISFPSWASGHMWLQASPDRFQGSWGPGGVGGGEGGATAALALL